jgi:hypothetical protein
LSADAGEGLKGPARQSSGPRGTDRKTKGGSGRVLLMRMAPLTSASARLRTGIQPGAARTAHIRPRHPLASQQPPARSAAGHVLPLAWAAVNCAAARPTGLQQAASGA